ncbi:phospho-N-acetylmuramoyl-pentapeptide-transferase [Sulfurihydrogenibium azorense]|uniref:phospho-N-acetylmuramoyl-pentapeptide- transferase n=1 Tax=Sulfurihydrogenibium azorense TaxID=309806 RepID=UPI0024093EA8|nr:phospho-N-acetylmuramoyl-pentapeptide-transferase [Sulfurihydrogenibium azorense]MDM7273321.1 phospho-N-acetylmuramoyl-pentapeptide-transferase [Sulfurihydrogenibium azorense]
MFYHIFYEYLDVNIFKYITFRGFYALLTAFFISLILGPYIIERLKVFQNKQGGYVRQDTPDWHQIKKHTPTMGGVLILLSVLFTSLLWCRLDNVYIWLLMFTFLSFGLIGFLDDYKKIKDKKGLSSKAKFLMQLVSATLISVVLYLYPKFNTVLYFPFFKNLSLDLGIFYIPLMIFIIVGASNAVNLTDGLDGLAIGPSLISVSTFAVFAYISGNIVLSKYLIVPYVEGSGEITVFLLALLGAGLGFLWFNSFPAEMFMGDAGALSIGAVLGLTSIITKQEIVLAIVGGIFVLETLSVIAQVSYYRLTGGKRLFKMAPIHHHFELHGIPEPKIVVRVWIISLLLSIIALSTLKIR